MATNIDINYNPNPKQKEFHESSSMYKGMVGALGSGKSSTLCVESLILSLEHQNVGLLARKTLPELNSTTLKRFFEYLPDHLIVDYRTTKRELYIKNNLGGTSLVIFGPLDEINRYKSLELGWFAIDEADETSEDHWLTLCGRLRLKGVPLRGMLSTNPTTKSHWIYKRFVESPMKGYELFRSKTVDNQANLPPGYIENLRENYTLDWQKRYLDGEFGLILKGDPVLPEFATDKCVKTLEPRQNLKMIRGWDFGRRHPCVVFAQISDGGKMSIFRTVKGENEDLYAYRDRIIRLSNKWYNTFTFIDYCDPSGTQQRDTGKPSVEVLKEKGIMAMYRRTSPSDRARELRRMIREGNFEMDACNDYLIEGALGGYQVDEEGDPVKDGYYDHGWDAVGYIVANEIMANVESQSRVEIPEPRWGVRK